MIGSSSFLQVLDTAAHEAAMAEKAYRREAADRIKLLERARSFAFRRLGLLQVMSDAVGRAESEEMAVANCLAILRAKLGWLSEDDEARSAVLTRFALVAKAMFAHLQPAEEVPAPNVVEEMIVFEAWYESSQSTSFWNLFDQPMVETPLVDF
ncbi:hypothetical protein [Dongia sp.]|uniref:hypothetical protein n=1 Tax=Dongia sp. TaxID=1977262 RepID=UPI0035B3D79E